MKIITFIKLIKTPVLFAIVGGILAFPLTACSEQKEATTPTKEAKPSHNPNPFDHSGDLKVTDSQKDKFEKDFAAQCIERELKNSVNPDNDRDRVTRPCNCIADFLAKNLTGEEAEKFLSEHENPQSLRIKYENAAYHCLQAKTPPHEEEFSHPK
jgi:hypothetical protein